jgi:hypothetical protein
MVSIFPVRGRVKWEKGVGKRKYLVGIVSFAKDSNIIHHGDS